MNGLDALYPYGRPVASGRIKCSPADFVVVEELGFEPSGEGEHLLIQVEKTGLGTVELLQRIARDCEIAPAAIGFSGQKDKQATTTQWFSLHLPGRNPALESEGHSYRILRAVRHHRKLRRGSHRANRFRIVIRQLEELPEASRRQLQQIANHGIANYFGEQRFGHGGDNVEQALRQLGAKKLKRQRRGILLSSLRSYLFNQILARRIAAGHWREPVDGDVFMLRGSHSVFSEPLDETLRQRYRDFDISSCASLYGAGRSLSGGDARAIEEAVFAEHGDITDCLDRCGAKLQMRALRVPVEDFDYSYDEVNASLELAACLPAGSYLTTLVEHFLRIEDASQRDF